MFKELWFFALLLPIVVAWIAFHKGALPGEPRGARFLEVEGVRVRFTDTESDGPTSLLIHGFASSLDAWKPVAPVLATNQRVVALDLKGFGWTDRPHGDYSPEAQAALVLAFMTARGIEKAAVVAHSWGSAVAFAMALAAPERVTKLALYDAWVFEDQLPTFFHWARAHGIGEMMFAMYYQQRPRDRVELAFHDPRHITKELVAEVQAGLDRPGTVAAALAAVRGQRFKAMEKRYPTITQPTLLLWGANDRIASIKAAERLMRELPNARLSVYPSCGHFPMIEARDASNRDLVAFLEEREEKAA